jgi:hypothetical protein
MTHIRKLQLIGRVCNRGKIVQSYYSWPRGEKHSVVESIIRGFKRAFCNVSVVITHNLDL